ncbi:MAG: DUF721 domain-containing protein [Paludibacteraceae bacterium]|nr:DUF721 domain-containing protein [Paludibacteraceae bacterium]
MKRKNASTISSILQEYVHRVKIDEDMLALDIERVWPELVGEEFVQYTQGMMMKNKQLYVTMLSPAASHELMMRRSEILKKIHEKFDIDSTVLSAVHF